MNRRVAGWVFAVMMSIAGAACAGPAAAELRWLFHARRPVSNRTRRLETFRDVNVHARWRVKVNMMVIIFSCEEAS